MGVQIEGPNKTFEAGEALAAFRRVKLNGAGIVVYADIADVGFGVTQNEAALGENVTVRLYNAEGTFKVEANTAIAVDGPCYTANDGKVDNVSASSTKLFIALEASSGAGAIIEMLRQD